MKTFVLLLTIGVSLVAAQTNGTVPQTNVSNSTAGQTFITGGGCAQIPGIGSPVLMISNAHKFIEDALNIKNTYTNVKYLYFLKTSPATDSNISNYRLVFSVTDYNGTKFIGVDLDQSPFGIGSVKINKFLLTGDAARIRQFIDPNFTNKVTFTCGDQKYVYSSFGNDPTAQFDYLFPGRNQNSAGLNVLNNLLPSSGSSAAFPVGGNPAANAARVCTTSNFSETINFFGILGALGLVTPVDLISCLPNENAVSQIRISCVNNTVQSVQLAFNNLNDNGTTLSAFAGNPNTPASSITTIDLNPANTIVFSSNTVPGTNLPLGTALGVRIQTQDAAGNTLSNFTCGIVPALLNVQTLLVSRFLGFGNVIASAAGVGNFDLVTYTA